MTASLWAAAGLQALIALANLPLERRLQLEAELSKLGPIARQVFRVHHAYLVGLLLFFAGVTPFLGRKGALEEALSAMLAVFWATRLAVQRLYYDPGTRRRHRGWDALFPILFAALAALFAATAVGGWR